MIISQEHINKLYTQTPSRSKSREYVSDRIRNHAIVLTLIQELEDLLEVKDE